MPHLKAGHSLRFAFLPAGDDPDSFIAANGPAAMTKLLEAALPLSDLLWRSETEGKDFSTPERRAGLEHVLREIVARITDAKVADYYRRGFDERVFEEFQATIVPAQGRPCPGAVPAAPGRPPPGRFPHSPSPARHP